MMKGSRMSKRQEQGAAGIEALPFEKAIARVEELVSAMDNSRLPLEDLIKYYEEGTELLKVCRQRLEEAQKKIDLITRRSDGTLELNPLATDETPDAHSGTARSRPQSVTPLEENDEPIPF
jgi:exodeoxyribonuclease VII small subunit